MNVSKQKSEVGSVFNFMHLYSNTPKENIF